MNRKKLVVFDMDGTILDTLDDLKESLNVTFRKFGFPERTREEVQGFVGNGIPKLIERAVPAGVQASVQEEVLKTFLEYYQIHCNDLTRPYKGIPELMKWLKEQGCLIAVASNKADPAVGKLCDIFFTGLVDFAVGDLPGQKKKPAPDMVNRVLNTLQIEKEEAVYIGDSEVDIATAKNAGLDCIVVTWGFRDRDLLEKSGGKLFADTTEQVQSILTAAGCTSCHQ